MSQKKIDLYKQEKANRKKKIAKDKQLKVVKAVGSVISCILIVAIIVVSAKFLSGDFDSPTTAAPKSLSEEDISFLKSLGLTDNDSDQTSSSDNTTTNDDSTTAADDSTTTN